jgi:hypothetical protein
MSGEAWLYLFAVIINAVNLFLQVFFTIMYSDLEWYGTSAQRHLQQQRLFGHRSSGRRTLQTKRGLSSAALCYVMAAVACLPCSPCYRGDG